MTTPVGAQWNSFVTHSDGSVSFYGEVWWPAGTSSASGAGVMVLGPGGARASFPAVKQGTPGITPSFNISQVIQAYGTALPQTNPVQVATAWDSNGIPTAYDLVFYNQSGPPGDDASVEIPSSLDGVNAAQASYIGWDAPAQQAKWAQLPVGNWQYATGISASASNTTTQKQVASILVQAQPYDWWPEVDGEISVIGAVDTQINAVARVNGSSGAICGYGYGAAGASPGPIGLHKYGLGVGSTNIVPAGQAKTIYLYAENQTASPNAWSTTSSAFFQVKPHYVLSTL